MRRKSFFLAEGQIEMLALYANHRDRPQSEIVRAALDLYFSRAALNDPHVQELMARVSAAGKDDEAEAS